MLHLNTIIHLEFSNMSIDNTFKVENFASCVIRLMLFDKKCEY